MIKNNNNSEKNTNTNSSLQQQRVDEERSRKDTIVGVSFTNYSSYTPMIVIVNDYTI